MAGGLQIGKYISYRLVKRGVSIISIISFIALIIIRYDMDYHWVLVLPVFYFACTHFFLRSYMLNGMGSITVVCMYSFRMCILPVLCAYGNFYIEPSESIYLRYFWVAVLLMCFECFIVFVALAYYERKYINKIDYFIKDFSSGRSDSFVVIVALGSFIIYMIIVILHPGFILNHYRLLFSSAEEATAFELANVTLASYGTSYYIIEIIDIAVRPIMSFVIVNWALKKNNWYGTVISVIVGVFNIMWISDRRVLSLLVGVCCMVQVLLHVRSKVSKHAIYWIIGIFAILTIVYCFVGEDTPLRVARKFQRYFSGPSLTAIGVAVYSNYTQTPLEFIKLLFNDSLILTGLFDAIPMRGYVLELCGASGRSIWTPMFIGAIQYFHVFAPLLLIGIVKFLVYTDFRANVASSELKRMMFNYLSIAISVYMVMYSIDLIYYNIIFIGGFYYFIFSVNTRIPLRIRLGRRH